MVADIDGSRVADGNGNIVAVDNRGNELQSGNPGDPATGRFYDPASGTWQDGAVNPDTGERVYRLDNGTLLIENRTKDGDAKEVQLRSDGIEVRQFATLVESDRYGIVETFTRVEIGPATRPDMPRRLIQRSNSCPAGVEHPPMKDLPVSVFVHSGP